MNNKFLDKISLIIIILSIILNSGSAISLVYSSWCYYLLIFSFLLLLFKYLVQVKSNKKRISVLEMNLLVLFYIMIASLIINNDFAYLQTYFKYVLFITSAYIIVKIWDFDTIIKYFISIMVGMSFISLIFFSIGIMYPNIINSLPVMHGPTTDYYHIFIYNIATYSLKRNMGIFWEPSIFSSFLCIAIFFVLFGQKNNDKLKLILLITALFTTQSTGGYLCFMLIIVSRLFMSKKSTYSYVFNFSLLLLGLFLILNWESILNVLYDINPMVFQKLYDKTENISYSVRLSCPIINMQLFADNPFFGNGLGNTNNLFYNMTSGLVSQTSMTTYSLASLGIFSSILSISFIISVIKHNQYNFYIKLIFLAVFFMIINKESHFFFLFTYVIIFGFIESFRKSKGSSL